MNSTLGYSLVLLGLGFAAFAAVVGIVSGLMRREGALVWVQRAVYGFCASMIGSNLVMVKALLEHDFSVKYVAQVGSRATPVLFTIVSLWSRLEGSILFWGAIMGAYLFAFTWTYRKEHGRYMQLALGVMAAVAVFFAFLIAGPANPWTALPNPPMDGPGPNALLQNHFLMIIHPPMLYGGYVGMTVPFGIAAGALLRGELGDAWLVPLRKWTLVPWLFLSIGIILGGWWAYAVLGWGGYWAWDPVENASFLPWLTATAFMHQTFVLERKKTMKVWAMVLALASFCLTILGTFMTRSGVFNSVHSFTQSDIGPTFLVFIAIVLVFSVLLLATRSHLLVSEAGLEGTLSRGTFLVLATVAFTVFMVMVLNGTLFPLITEAVQNKKITVGEPYFNYFAAPFGMIMLFLMGVGPMLPWNAVSGPEFVRQVQLPVAAGIVTTAACFAFGYRGFVPLATFGLGAFVAVVTVRELLLPARQRAAELKESFGQAFMKSTLRAQRRTGGLVVHLGIVIIVVAVAASSSYKVYATGTLSQGQELKVGDHTVRFDGLGNGRDERREWLAANVTITAPNGATSVHHDLDAPRMNFYDTSNEPVGSPLVHATLTKDVYVSLLAFDQKTNSASFNAWEFPLVGWIWYAIPILVLGIGLALWPQRKAKAAQASSPQTASADAPGAAA